MERKDLVVLDFQMTTRRKMAVVGEVVLQRRSSRGLCLEKMMVCSAAGYGFGIECFEGSTYLLLISIYLLWSFIH